MKSRIQLIAALIVLAATLLVGARKTGAVPALGDFLDPAHGVWAMARTATLPGEADGSIAGLDGSVRVIYDDRAVPHIFATTESDAYRALGYVVARDRLFQMYLQTMAAAGRLTELAGPRALPLDREMRDLGLPAAAEAAARKQAGGPEFTSAAAAFADGVNAYVDQMPASALPLEFRLLGKRPERWRVVDAYHLLGRMGYTLAYLDAEAARYAAAGRVGFPAADALFPSVSPIQEPVQPTGKASPRLDFHPLPPPGAPDPAARVLAEASARVRAPGDPPTIYASNNWAVSPRRSANGHALLEGDPHLDLTLPSIWYEVHLVVPGKLDVYGVTIPGAPFVVIGFNRDVAWSLTNSGVDVLDYYDEHVDDDARPSTQTVDGTPLRLTPRVEVYRDDRGRTIATDTTLYGLRGPVSRIGGRWISTRWTVLESGSEPRAFLNAQRSTSAAELEDGFAASYKAPAQNVVAADRAGHIMLRSTGRFPMRPGDGRGDSVRDGSLTASDWRGDVPVNAYPHALDPAQGFVASANQQPLDPAASPYWWGGDFDPWRALRINELLRADSSVTVDDIRSFQTDPGSTRARLFMTRILAGANDALRAAPAGAERDKLAQAVALLGEWDLRYTRDNRRAVLFEETMTELVNRTWDELLPDSGSRRVATPPSAVLLELMSDSTSAWWDDRRTPARESRDDVIAASLVAALERTTRRYGPPTGDGWRWDRIRFANVNHLLRLPALSAQNIPVQGGPGTMSPSSGNGSHGPSWRMVVDLGPDVRAWTTYPGGQSGNPFSPRYRDRIDQWARGELDEVRFPRSADEIAGARQAARLTLRPR